ncbi:hypothetical protein KFL_009530030 [Klebsormidium nitens]|uniref:SWIM-type domain-containing protein n=1 Tax=Klebsormidium nitens TaxID=105231 RepID=A0A1Y1ITU1_KLENI|nr:hypothetical protein KFL_009530030 [Klebsormidium nitens]|eukprot:GAQ92236.1 hypothetical protein KFL_009530030 [Klebsormidium nitens]
MAKGQRKQQALCLECVKRHIGCVTVTSLTVSVTEESAQVWFERSLPADAWRQQKSLLGEEIVALQVKEEEARHEFSGRCSATAAETAVNRGRHAGEIPRKAPIQPNQHSDASAPNSSSVTAPRTLAAQAAHFVAGISSGQIAFFSVGEQNSASTVYLATPWNHNTGTAKAVGRPSKARALPETVYWDTMGNATCSCDRGRLYFEAPCVHKLALQALEVPRRASHISLQRGPRVSEVPCEGAGERVWGVYWNAGSPSPHRTMVHYSAAEEFPWYCKGRQSGCSKTADCSHILEVKRALERPEGLHRPVNRSFTVEQLERANVVLSCNLKTLEVAEGELEADGPGIARCLAELGVGSHQEAACKGDSCFCKLSPQVFDKSGQRAGAAPCAARCCSSLAAADRKRGRNLEQAEAAAEEAREKRRSKAYWAAREQAAAGGIDKVAFGGVRNEKPGGAAVSGGRKENGASAVSGGCEGNGALAVSGRREGVGGPAVSGVHEGVGGAAVSGVREGFGGRQAERGAVFVGAVSQSSSILRDALDRAMAVRLHLLTGVVARGQGPHLLLRLPG